LPDDLTVGAEWSMTDKPARVSAIEVIVRIEPMSPETLERFRKVIEHCTVHNTLAGCVETSIRIEPVDAWALQR
jgi:uncharacterized OsmC-like protein